MTVITKNIGRLSLLIGEYDSTHSYGKRNRVTLFGSEFESKHDNNNTAPATWDGNDTVTFNEVDWLVVSNGTDAWLAGQNKSYEPENFSGMGRVVLKKHLVEVEEEVEDETVTVTKNLLYQDDFYKDDPDNPGQRIPNTNTVFVIKHDFTLASNVTIPANCVLEFDGGSISGNGETVSLNNCYINADVNDEVFNGILFSGKCSNNDIYISNFHLKYTQGEDDADIINSVANMCNGGATLHLNLKNNCYISYPTGHTPWSGWENSVSNISINVPGLRVIQDSPYYLIANGVCKDGGFVCLDADNMEAEDLKIDTVDGSYFISSENFGTNGLCIGGKNSIVRRCVVKNFNYPIDSADLDENGYLTKEYSGSKGIMGETNDNICTIEDCIIENCYMGIFFQHNTWLGNPNRIIVEGCTISGCNIAVYQFNSIGNSNPQPEDFEALNGNTFYINNTLIKDSVGQTGILCFGEGSGVMIDNCRIIGTTKVDSIIRGRIRNSYINLICNQPCNYLVSSKPVFTYSRTGGPFKDSIVNITHINEYDYVFNSEYQQTPASDVTYHYLYATFNIYCVKLPSNTDNKIYDNTEPQCPFTWTVYGYFPLNVSGVIDLRNKCGNNYSKLLSANDLVKNPSALPNLKAPVGTVVFGSESNDWAIPYIKWKNEKWLNMDGTWIDIPRRGTTAQRPPYFKGVYIGFMYIDDDLGGKPIFYTGDTTSPHTGWIDATGADV